MWKSEEAESVKPIKVAVVAIACSPRHPSEAGLGWKAVVAMAANSSITLFTHRRNQEEIQAYLDSQECSDDLKKVRFVFVGRCHNYHRNQAIARLLNWHYYRRWLADCAAALRNYSLDGGIDLIHHVTYSTWRMGSPFHRLGIPTVWGPVGGAGSVPLSAFDVLSPAARFTEGLRLVLSLFYRNTLSFKKSLESCSVVLASNNETRQFLEKHTQKKIRTVFPTYFEPVRGFPGATRREPGEPLRCFFGGGLIGSKGVSLSLRAMAMAVGEGFDIVFKVAGEGPERRHLRSLAEDLGIADRVQFLPLLSGDDYSNVLRQAHVFVFPSFRENIGITMVDAMLFETAPIVLNTSAPGEIVTEECGWKICLASRDQMVESICLALRKAYDDPAATLRKSVNARERVLKSFTLSEYSAAISSAYAEALAANRRPSGVPSNQ